MSVTQKKITIPNVFVHNNRTSKCKRKTVFSRLKPKNVANKYRKII